MGSIILHDGAAVNHPGPGDFAFTEDGSVGGIPAIANLGLGRKISGIIRLEITSIPAPITSPTIRMFMSSDGILFGINNNGWIAPIPAGAGPQILDFLWNNVDFVENDPTGLRQHVKVQFFLFFAGSSITTKVTLFGATIFTLEDGSGVDGANAYHSTSDTNATIDCFGVTNYFNQLDLDRQEKVSLVTTRQIERSVRKFVNGRQVNPEKKEQILLFPRDNATDYNDDLIIGLPPNDFIEGIDLFMNVVARAEFTGESSDIREAEGLKRIRDEPEDASFEVEFFNDRSTDFLDDHPDIKEMIASAYPCRVSRPC